MTRIKKIVEEKQSELIFPRWNLQRIDLHFDLKEVAKAMPSQQLEKEKCELFCFLKMFFSAISLPSRHFPTKTATYVISHSKKSA